MTEQRTETIRIWGIVQGVGFRPFVAKTAHQIGIKGQVRNIGGLVEILLTDTKEKIDTFVKTIEEETNPPAEIVHIKRSVERFQSFEDFTIADSQAGDDQPVMVPTDSAICPDCLAELREPNNPRHNHPLISCMACGPRYTILDRIPYDRANTTMAEFPMCDFCREQYTDLHNRRYHAQTISCHQCGPKLSQSIDGAAKSLKQGQVIAFKSTGGYNLVCDPFNDQGVDKLRQIKKREQKPFALMFKDLDQIKQYCHVDETEAKLLQSLARPILLLERKQCDSAHKPYDKERNPDNAAEFNRSRFIGAFLPGMGAQYLLLDQISPLIFTSANTSDMPMIKDDSEMDAMIKQEHLINSRLGNDRLIRVRVDDSVVRVIDGQPQMIRRARGYAPTPLYVSTNVTNANVDDADLNNVDDADLKKIDDANINTEGKDQFLATGGQLKNSFALSKGPFVYMSQYFGDLDSVENQEIYKENIDQMKALFRMKPKAIVCDLHPLYFTTKFAKEQELPLLQVQHHHAHVASVMAEHNLQGKVIGVSFDGTGYGTDGAIWGGEFLLCEQGEYERVKHLFYVNMPGGDRSMREAWKSAVAYRYAREKDWKVSEKNDPPDGTKSESSKSDALDGIKVDIEDILSFAKDRRWQEEAIVEKAFAYGVNTVKSSSMGRLFDAVSALLGIKDHNDYEGQCAMLLEDAAARAIRGKAKGQADELALAFHRRIAGMILEQCFQIGKTKQVALTGGVFQNKVLMEETLKLLRQHGFQPYYNISVSPNDGGIALGQIYIALHRGMSWQ